MRETHTEKMLKVFEEHPEGLTVDELRIKLSRKHNKDVQNTIQLLKQGGNKFDKDGNKYVLTKNSNKIRRNPTNKTQGTFDLIKASPDGITPEELAEKFDCDASIISSRIYRIRESGENIKFKFGKYHYVDGSKNAPDKTIESAPNTNETMANKLLPKKYQPAFINLSDNDKVDCIDMLRKSLYYHKSAISLLESSMEIESFFSSIGGI